MPANVVLWGGPEDGKVVAISSGENTYVLDSPSDRAPEKIVGISGMLGNVEIRKACYRYNKDTKRFEWGEYL